MTCEQKKLAVCDELTEGRVLNSAVSVSDWKCGKRSSRKESFWVEPVDRNARR